MNYLKTTEGAEVNNYPYGSLKCTAFFGLEFDKKKGFRSTFQTINPKTNRLNKPKKSTYSDLIVLTDTDGFIKSKYFSFNGVKQMNETCKFIHENFNLFTPEQIEYFYLMVITHTKVSIQAAHIYCNSPIEALKPIFEPAIKAAVQGANSKENIFDKIVIDEAAYEATKVPDYQPFKTTEIFVIGG